jgi:serine/threonine protein phosphatase PrpC
MLGDFTGHGLASALGALPVSDVFRAMTAKGFAPQQILQAMNIKLHSLLPTSMFLAAQFIHINQRLDSITVFNCGMPDCYLLDGQNRTIKSTIQSASLPLGITPDIDFQSEAQVIPINQGDRVVLATDGVTEARNQAGESFGSERFIQSLTSLTEDKFALQSVDRMLSEFVQEAPQDDDISLVETPLVPEIFPELHTEHLIVKSAPEDESDLLDRETDSIEFHITLRGGQLRQADPVPMLINYLQETSNLKAHREALFTIFTELFVNALDHGILKLNSSIKQEKNGFSRYFEMREQALKCLTEGFIRIGVRVHSHENGGFVVFQIEDSGKGFDIDEIIRQSDDEQMFSGRGIALIENLCESISYIQPGNKCEVIYRWLDD